jgi:hypothetical protein
MAGRYAQMQEILCILHILFNSGLVIGLLEGRQTLKTLRLDISGKNEIIIEEASQFFFRRNGNVTMQSHSK